MTSITHPNHTDYTLNFTNSPIATQNCTASNCIGKDIIDFHEENECQILVDRSNVVDANENNVESSSFIGDNVGIAIQSGTQISIKEAEESELLYLTAKNDQEAYDLYNEYAFRKGFSIRKGKVRPRRHGDTWSMRRFVCSNAGFKNDHKKSSGAFDKLITRTGCKAFLQFKVDQNGVYTAVRHEMIHNHHLIPSDKVHYLRSQRRVHKNQFQFMKTLKESGVPLIDAYRVARNEVGGSPYLGFTARDAYNAMTSEKRKELDGQDCKNLIRLFAKRQAKEADFFYEFELDDTGTLISFFWRDGRMKRDYEFFGDLLVFDTTYRTNKYGMICAPFVGMNHHCNNVMFGMGFLLNERIESFVWLFESFSSSTSRGHPITIMTDQSAAMAAAIKIVFPESRHRLCTWHLGQNSIANIGNLRALEGFSKLFDYLLKYCDTPAEFEHYWARMLEKYKCFDNKWLNSLYGLKEKWCPAYSKDYFSGGVLSSQRSESTNNSVSHRLKKTDALCDFYHTFLDVVAEWRSKENAEDCRNLRGNRHLAFANVGILVHAREVYTGEVYLIFEEQFVKGTSCVFKDTKMDGSMFEYYVWRPDIDLIKHQVRFNKETHDVECTCKYATEVGILCSHSLRVYHAHCVARVPAKYIMKRWCKTAMTSHSVDEYQGKTKVVASSVWRVQALRKFFHLITACQDVPTARDEVESSFISLKEKVESVRGIIDFGNEEEEDVDMSHITIKDPPRANNKYERNIRPKGALEKACNKAKAWRKRNSRYVDATKFCAQKSVKDIDLDIGSYVHPTSPTSTLFECNIENDKPSSKKKVNSGSKRKADSSCNIAPNYNESKKLCSSRSEVGSITKIDNSSKTKVSSKSDTHYNDFLSDFDKLYR